MDKCPKCLMPMNNEQINRSAHQVDGDECRLLVMADLRRQLAARDARIAELEAEKNLEISNLTDRIDLMCDEFLRIKACSADGEIVGLCERAVANIRQNVPVVAQLDNANTTIMRLEAEIAGLREALEWYANRQSYQHQHWSGDNGKTIETYIPVDRDCGRKARAALSASTPSAIEEIVKAAVEWREAEYRLLESNGLAEDWELMHEIESELREAVDKWKEGKSRAA